TLSLSHTHSHTLSLSLSLSLSISLSHFLSFYHAHSLSLSLSLSLYLSLSFLSSLWVSVVPMTDRQTDRQACPSSSLHFHPSDCPTGSANMLTHSLTHFRSFSFLSLSFSLSLPLFPSLSLFSLPLSP